MTNKLFSFDDIFPETADQQTSPFDCNDRQTAPSHMDDIFPSMTGSDFFGGRDAAPKVRQAEKAPRELGSQHIILVLCIDKSTSMSGSASLSDIGTSCIALVNQYANDMISTNMLGDLDKERVDMCVISFSSEVVIEKDFAPMSEIGADFHLEADGVTSLYSALITAVEAARKRRNMLLSQGVECFKPVIFLLTDGGPTDIEYRSECRQIMKRYIDKDAGGKTRMSLVVCGVPGFEYDTMVALSPEAKVIALRDSSAIGDMFKLITASIACMSQSNVSDDLHISFDKLKNLGVVKGQSRTLDLN